MNINSYTSGFSVAEENGNEIFTLVYHLLQSKLEHVQYTTDKAIKFYHTMVMATEKNKAAISKTTRTVNRMYSLRARIQHKAEKLDGREKRYAGKVVSLLDDIIRETEDMSCNILHYTGVMRGATDNLLMTILKAVHYQWRERVYLSVMDRTIPFPAEDEGHCLLGWWYEHEGRKKFGHIPVFLRLGEEHRRLHRAEAELAAGVQQGTGTKSLLSLLNAFEMASRSVIGTLDELDEYLIRLNAVSADREA
ncbi:hypothetical protein DVF53_23540 [Salmonella enterica subsp. enterica serovar Kottbus]|nr:hypothetical protein [Salmonella enterica subsp. enterica serovar Kottbus]